ncbi:hypothetical protein BZK22_04805 [Helicobacter pylori]|nr:hypothetical protein BZK22_04805 [Helicobacter pylori]
MVGIKLKATYRFNQNQSVKSNQAVKLERSFKSVLACFDKDGLSAFRFLLFSIFYDHAVDFIF